MGQLVPFWRCRGNCFHRHGPAPSSTTRSAFTSEFEFDSDLWNPSDFAFLGYSFRDRFRFPRAKSHAKLMTTIRDLTPRKSGDSMKVIIEKINSSLRGWFNDFRHCFWNIFKGYDSHIRARLRRLLLKRNRRNPKRLPRNHRWPNAYFEDLGLYSLNEAHIRFVQSQAGNH